MNAEVIMKEFKKLLAIADELLAPGGCPWDREQTLFTLQPYLLEETHELIEAIDEQSGPKMAEELGDVFYALVFIAKLGETEGKFTLAQALQTVAEKLIRRHPHVFGDKKLETTEEILTNWEEVKKKEGKKSPIDGIPPSLPSLSRAQKVIHKLRKAKSEVIEAPLQTGDREGDLGYQLWALVKEAEKAGIDAESALRRVSLAYEEKFKNQH